MIAYNIISRMNKKTIDFPKETMLGALSSYIAMPNENYQPMNANFGIIQEMETNIKDKKERYSAYASRSLKKVEELVNEFKNIRQYDVYTYGLYFDEPQNCGNFYSAIKDTELYLGTQEYDAVYQIVDIVEVFNK